MSKRRSRGRNKQSGASRPTPSAVREMAAEGATPAERRAVADAEAPPGVGAEELTRQAAEALALAKARESRANTREDAAARAEEMARQKAADLEQRLSALRAQEAEAQARESHLADAEADLQQRRADIVRRELDADAGFGQRHREALTALEADAEATRAELRARRQRIADERAAADAEIDASWEETRAAIAAERAAAEASIDSDRQALDSMRAALQEQIEEVRIERRRVRLDRDMLDEDRDDLEDEIERRAARVLEIKDSQLSALTERLEAARSECARLESQVAEYETHARRFGNRSEHEVCTELRQAKAEVTRLQTELERRPGPAAVERLEELEARAEEWQAEERRLLETLADVRRTLRTRTSALTELEALREEKANLASSNALMRESNAQLRADVDKVIERAGQRGPFPACAQMDADPELQRARELDHEPIVLRDFVERVQHAMARPDGPDGEALFYQLADVRGFVAGLAMSPLHLLQGWSGTGKTSLPRAFCRAIGAPCVVVPVQAGWRDRHDLVGHYNTFERTFYESRFLQALYTAHTPRHVDQPMIIVLDEMNLSHPEQYFGDINSLLEQPPHARVLELMTAGVPGAPRHLSEGGKGLLLPPNVWFVGTANHDETTKDFAEKTYDRAHMMELPDRYETIEPTAMPFERPVALSALTAAFERARLRYADDGAKAYEFLCDRLGNTLRGQFRVTWANRLQHQMARYVPVVRACGGSVGEATDHILSTRLLRQLRHRRSNRPDDLRNLRETIETAWKTLCSASPRKSLALLDETLVGLGKDGW